LKEFFSLSVLKVIDVLLFTKWRQTEAKNASEKEAVKCFIAFLGDKKNTVQ
jgi:hypothetical protein